jgi:hypothetical protein
VSGALAFAWSAVNNDSVFSTGFILPSQFSASPCCTIEIEGQMRNMNEGDYQAAARSIVATLGRTAARELLLLL